MEEEKQPENIKSNSGSSNNPQNQEVQLSKHERKMLKEKEKNEQKSKLEKERSMKQLRAKTIKYTITFAIILLIGFGLYKIVNNIKNAPEPVTSSPVHWHAKFEVEICGKQEYLSNPNNKAVFGPMLTHTHGDNTMHIEGTIVRYEDITIGKFMDGIRVEFSNTTILDRKNGDLCPDEKPGTLKMFVNNEPNYEFENYIPKDGDNIRLVFD